MSVDIRPAGACKRRPISNGWSQRWNRETGHDLSHSWCGYCKAHIEHDAEWLAKFAAYGRALPTRT